MKRVGFWIILIEIAYVITVQVSIQQGRQLQKAEDIERCKIVVAVETEQLRGRVAWLSRGLGLNDIPAESGAYNSTPHKRAVGG